ncbi:MAG TPA: ribonuclease P protein component [Myxococcales bacterium]|nr:ribonuclease P protein component [Myxococcales bacterium]
MAAFAFPKSARLLRRKEFLAIREGGKGFAEGPLAASFRSREGSAPTRPGIHPAVARVGLTVSSRLGGSVLRNRIKRRLREAVRLEIDRLPAVDLVIVARASAAQASVEDFRGWLRRAAAKMRR